MSHIIGVVAKEDYKLEVFLENGSYIRWDNLIEISISEVFQLAQK